MRCSVDKMKVHYDALRESHKEENLNLIEKYLTRLGINFKEEKKNKCQTMLYQIIEKKDFIEFMNKTKKRYGILQLFKEIRHPFSSKNIHIYEKAITFETQNFIQKQVIFN